MFSIDYIENRKSGRHDVVIDTVLIVNGKSSEVRINNISSTGERFGPNLELAVSDKVMLILGETSVLSTVKWVGDNFVGIEFAKKQKKGMLNNLKAATN